MAKRGVRCCGDDPHARIGEGAIEKSRDRFGGVTLMLIPATRIRFDNSASVGRPIIAGNADQHGTLGTRTEASKNVVQSPVSGYWIRDQSPADPIDILAIEHRRRPRQGHFGAKRLRDGCGPARLRVTQRDRCRN
jgi:hypothetical protein